MDGGRRRLDYMRNDPCVALAILVDIDRISRTTPVGPTPDRQRDSWTADVEVERGAGTVGATLPAGGAG